MRVRIRRPQHQRRSRTLLAFALVIPAAGIVSAAGANSVSVTAATAFVALAVITIYDAGRVVLIVTRHGLGIAGPLFASIRWFAWTEVVEIDADAPVVSITTTGREMFQMFLEPRTAVLVASMVRRSMIARPPL